jgi:hypothetical protein
MKKVFAVLILATLIAGGVFAQSGGAKNWVGGQVGLLGAGVRYERFLTPNWSVGGAAYWNSLFFFWNNMGVKAFGRYFPWAGNFFAEMGLGFGYRTGTEDYEYKSYDGTTITAGDTVYAISGFLIEPGVGWKIDVGAPAGFYIEPILTLPIVMGSRQFDYSGADGEFKVGIGVIAAFGMGYAF